MGISPGNKEGVSALPKCRQAYPAVSSCLVFIPKLPVLYGHKT